MRIKLPPGERVLVRTRPNPLPLVGPVLAGFVILAVGGFGLGYLGRQDLPGGLPNWQPVLLPLAFAVVALLLFRVVVWPLVRWSSNRYVLTNMRLIHRHGMTRRTEHQLDLSAVSQLQIEQGLLQRLVGSGTLTAGLGFDRTHTYRDVPRIRTFREYVVQAIGDLPRTRMFDGVDMDIGPQHARGGTSWDQHERRGEQS